jgi:hypothetical protein
VQARRLLIAVLATAALGAAAGIAPASPASAHHADVGWKTVNGVRAWLSGPAYQVVPHDGWAYNNGAGLFRMEHDGSVKVWRLGSPWTSWTVVPANSTFTRLDFQDDGNLVRYNSDKTRHDGISDTARGEPKGCGSIEVPRLALQDDGNVVIYCVADALDPSGNAIETYRAVWATNTIF